MIRRLPENINRQTENYAEGRYLLNKDRGRARTTRVATCDAVNHPRQGLTSGRGP